MRLGGGDCRSVGVADFFNPDYLAFVPFHPVSFQS